MPDRDEAALWYALHCLETNYWHDVHHARLAGVISLYRADGRPPFQGERPPMLVADLSGDCVLGDDKVWRYQAHVLHPVFVGRDIPLSISIDTKILAEGECGPRTQA